MRTRARTHLIATTLNPSALTVYRATGCLIFGGWLWGLNLVIWSKHRINYTYLFEIGAVDSRARARLGPFFSSFK